jgi:hypothetical protein
MRPQSPAVKPADNDLGLDAENYSCVHSVQPASTEVEVAAVSGAHQVSGLVDQQTETVAECNSELKGDSIGHDPENYAKILEDYTRGEYHVDLDDIVRDTGIYRETAREWLEGHCIPRGCGMYEVKIPGVTELERPQEQKSKGNLEMLTPDQEEILIKVAKRLAQERKPITSFTLAFEARSQGLEIKPNLCQQWIESRCVRPFASVDEIEIVWLQDPLQYEYLRETIQTKKDGLSGKPKSPLPPGSVLVGFSNNCRGGERGKLRTTRFWWLSRYDRDLDPDGEYKVFSPCEAVVPSSIRVGSSSLSYSAIEERTPGRKMSSSRNEKTVT